MVPQFVDSPADTKEIAIIRPNIFSRFSLLRFTS